MGKGIKLFAGLVFVALLVKAAFDDLNPPSNVTEAQFEHWINTGLILGVVPLGLICAFVVWKLVKANQRAWVARPVLLPVPGRMESMTSNVDRDMRKAVGQIALLPELVEDQGNSKVDSLTGPMVLIDDKK